MTASANFQTASIIGKCVQLLLLKRKQTEYLHFDKPDDKVAEVTLKLFCCHGVKVSVILSAVSVCRTYLSIGLMHFRQFVPVVVLQNVRPVRSHRAPHFVGLPYFIYALQNPLPNLSALGPRKKKIESVQSSNQHKATHAHRTQRKRGSSKVNGLTV